MFINSATCSAPWEVSQIELQTNHVGLAFEFFFQRKNLTEQSQRQIHSSDWIMVVWQSSWWYSRFFFVKFGLSIIKQTFVLQMCKDFTKLIWKSMMDKRWTFAYSREPLKTTKRDKKNCQCEFNVKLMFFVLFNWF